MNPGSFYPCRSGGRHDFDWYSGWCRVHKCGVREDGRVVNVLTGAVLQPGPTYNDIELDKFRTRIERKYGHVG
jgi:hypothetical protein